MNILLYIALTIFWGCSFIAIKYTLEIFPPFFSAFLRTFLTVLFLSVFLVIWKRPSPFHNWKNVFLYAWIGIFAFAVPWAALFWGEQFIEPSIAGMLNSSVSIFVLLIAWIMIPQERPTRLGIMGVFLGVVGIVFIFLPSTDFSQIISKSFLGMLAMLVMSLSYGFNTVLNRKYGRRIDLVWIVWIQTLSSSVVLLLLAIANGEKMPSGEAMLAHPKSMISVFYLAFFSTTLAMLIYYHLINAWGALKASTLNYFLPFVAILVDYFVLSRTPFFQEWVGTIFIIGGVILIHYIKKKQVVVQG